MHIPQALTSTFAVESQLSVTLTLSSQLVLVRPSPSHSPLPPLYPLSPPSPRCYQVLVSLQSMVFVADPYYNEPGEAPGLAGQGRQGRRCAALVGHAFLSWLSHSAGRFPVCICFVCVWSWL
jgi:hypothetical protein